MRIRILDLPVTFLIFFYQTLFWRWSGTGSLRARKHLRAKSFVYWFWLTFCPLDPDPRSQNVAESDTKHWKLHFKPKYWMLQIFTRFLQNIISRFLSFVPSPWLNCLSLNLCRTPSWTPWTRTPAALDREHHHQPFIRGSQLNYISR